uniref:Uncharacterized protein n=2 Tax=Octopus bimaculoides TaxID=37653 RepID=A0A0L8GUU8_OCTBM
MQQEKKRVVFADEKDRVAVLTNDQQLYIMAQVKSNAMSVDNALKMAKQLSGESQDLPPELRKETKSPDIFNSEEIYNFAIILYQNGFSQPGTMCCMQIDFAVSVIHVIIKCRTKWKIPFRCIKEFYNEAVCPNQLNPLIC